MKNSSGILLLSDKDVVQYENKPCIRCGKCVDVCPMDLMPATLSTQIENGDVSGARSRLYGLDVAFEEAIDGVWMAAADDAPDPAG